VTLPRKCPALASASPFHLLNCDCGTFGVQIMTGRLIRVNSEGGLEMSSSNQSSPNRCLLDLPMYDVRRAPPWPAACADQVI
jgi:hypothetical protein